MSNTYTVTDEQTGITLVYKYCSDCGWSFVVSGYKDREECRQAMLLANKYFPKQSEEHKKKEKEMVEFCRGLVIDYD